MDHSRRPILITTETTQKSPILIIDKKGDIGNVLVEKLKEQFLIVYVSSVPPLDPEKHIHIQYGKKIPMIPDNIYSHIFVLYNGENETLDMLPSLIKKAEQNGAKLLFITSLLNSSPSLLKQLEHSHPHLEIVIFGELFGDNTTESNQLSLFIQQARLSGQLSIPNTGMRKTYPILFDDVIASIIALGFALDKRRKLVCLFSAHAVTEMSLARMLQKIDPTLKIDFKKEKDKEFEVYIPPTAEYIFHNYDIESKLKKINLSKKDAPPVEPKRKASVIKKRKKRNTKLFSVFIVIAILFLPILTSYFLLLTSYYFLDSSFKIAETGDFQAAKTDSQIAKTSLDTDQLVENTLVLLNIFAQPIKDNLSEQIQTGQEVAQTEIDSFTAANMIKDISAGKSLNPQNDFLHSLATFKNSLITLQKLKAEKKLPQTVLVKFSKIESTLNIFENTIDTFPSLLGFDMQKQYLLLFQNNMELRPGGGFIGSYGLLKIKDGKVITFKVYDVYDADGKLSQNIEPPFALRRYLGASHWFMRDSNFDVDFSKNAATITNFLKLEVGENVDGVIAIDTDFLKKMLEVLGKVTVPEYNETVTPDNFYLITQNHAEKNFFPGSTQKKDFLKSLSNAILLQLSDNKNVSKIAMINKVGEAINEKHVLFAFPQTAIQQLFTVNNLSASLWDKRSRGDNEILDYLGINEANLGTNKANYYLKRSIDQKTSIDEQGSVHETVMITYQNTSTQNNPYGGDYKNYLRFILPAGANIQAVSINQNLTPTTPAITAVEEYTKKNFIPPPQLEVEQTQEEGKTIYGFLIIVPTGQTKTVSLDYTLQQTIDPNRGIFNYNTKILKQPGTEQDPFTLSISYPSVFKLLHATQDVSDVGGKAIYSTNLNQDKSLEINLTRK